MVDLLKALIADHLAVPPSAVVDAALFKDDLGADSLDMIQLAMRVETELDIQIHEAEAEACVTVADALGLVSQKVSAYQ